MTKSRPSKKECWKTWKDQVEIMMAKKRTRSIAIAVGLCAYSLFYPFREKQKSREAMENCGVSPHGLTTAFLCLSPSHISQPQESSSSVNWEGVVSMAAEGGVGQTTSTPPTHIAGSLETEQRWLLLSMRSPFFPLKCLDSQGLFGFSA